jgi:DNA polymerase-1
MLSQDPVMMTIFAEGVDYHLRTAQLIAQTAWGMKPEDVTDVQRTGAKSFNFGILYGMSDESIAARAHCSVEEAAKIRVAIFGRMARLKKWVDEVLSYARRTGVSWTYWEGQPARRRPLWRIGDNMNGHIRATAEHGAVNSPVQGTATEFCTASLVKVVNLIDAGMPAQVCLAIYDALLLLARKDDALSVARSVRDAMLAYETQGVPLEVDCKMGPTWGSMEKQKL